MLVRCQPRGYSVPREAREPPDPEVGKWIDAAITWAKLVEYPRAGYLQLLGDLLWGKDVKRLKRWCCHTGTLIVGLCGYPACRPGGRCVRCKPA
jgi:hypothetical protein